jgi:hypothetical protein
LIRFAKKYQYLRGMMDGNDTYWADGNTYLHTDISKLVGFQYSNEKRLTVDVLDNKLYLRCDIKLISSNQSLLNIVKNPQFLLLVKSKSLDQGNVYDSFEDSISYDELTGH